MWPNPKPKSKPAVNRGAVNFELVPSDPRSWKKAFLLHSRTAFISETSVTIAQAFGFSIHPVTSSSRPTPSTQNAAHPRQFCSNGLPAGRCISRSRRPRPSRPWRPPPLCRQARQGAVSTRDPGTPPSGGSVRRQPRTRRGLHTAPTPGPTAARLAVAQVAKVAKGGGVDACIPAQRRGRFDNSLSLNDPPNIDRPNINRNLESAIEVPRHQRLATKISPLKGS